MLYNVALVSAIYQHESDIGIHMSLPSGTSLSSHLTPLGSQSTTLCFLHYYNNFPLPIYFTHSNVYVSMLLSQFVSPSPSPAVSINLFSEFVFLSCKEVHQYQFSRFQVYVLIYGICFSLSDLLHSV